MLPPNGNGDPPTSERTTRSGRVEAMNQLGQPLILFGLIVAINMGVVFAGIGLLRGVFEGPNYLAVVTGLLGLIGGGALGMAVPGRSAQRSTDSPALTTAFSSTTTTSTIPPPPPVADTTP